MSKAEYVKAVQAVGAELANYTARICGVSVAQVQLWAASV